MRFVNKRKSHRQDFGFDWEKACNAGPDETIYDLVANVL